jgi:dTDP-4-amino-4,6-dideoxygalactose transaminase/acetyltransferase-like isoleucine patch superfamily enzyme
VTPLVHPTAIVEPGAELGEGTRVWHHAHVRTGASIGPGCMLGKGVYDAATAQLGRGVRVQNGVSVFDGVRLDDDVFVGPHAVFTNVRAPRAFVDRKDELERTTVERGATIGAGAVVVCGVTIGAFAFVGAGAVVTHDVPAHALVVGNPARRIGWVSRVGRRLPHGRVVACPETGERYLVEADRCRPLGPEETDSDDDSPIPLVDLAAQHSALLPELRAAFDRIVTSGRFVLGEEVERLEAELAERLGVRHAIGVSSGTDALLAAMMALGVGPGDEVVTTALSFFATAGSIARLGATPVFVDVEADSMNLDAGAVRAAITPKTKAILPVHLFGRPCSLEVFDVAARAGVPVVEDAAQALGATTSRGAAGTLGLAGCFSFFPTKNLGALGDGGLVVTNDARFAEKVRLLRGQGARPRYHHVALGGNFRLDALQAALLRVKLPHLDRWTEERRATAAHYEAAFASIADRSPSQDPRADRIVTPGLAEGHVHHQYVLRSAERDALRGALERARIGTEIYYPEPLHLAPCFEALGSRIGEHPIAERICREALAIPVALSDPSTRARVARAVMRAILEGRTG